MSLSKKEKRKHPDVPLDERLKISKGKPLDTSLQTTETISKNENEVHESPLENDPTSQLPDKQTTENHSELCKMYKKLERKKKRSMVPLKNYDPGQELVEENLNKFGGKFSDSSFQNNKTFSEITSEVHGTTTQGVSNLELPVNRNEGQSSQSAENHAEVSSARRKIKRRKRCNDPENKNLGKEPLETGSLCGSEVTNIEHHGNSELESLRNKKNHKALMGNNLITVEPSILLACGSTNSMKRNDVSIEMDMNSSEVNKLKTYQRKTKNLILSPSDSFELGEEEGSSPSLQVQNSSMGDVCVNYSDTTHISVESKWRVKSEIVKDEDELHVVQKLGVEIGVSEEEDRKNSPKILLLSSDDKLEKVKEVGPISLQVAQNGSTGDISADCSDGKLALGKRKRNKKDKMKVHGDKALKDISLFKPSDEHSPQESEGELNTVQKAIQEPGLCAENMADSPTDWEDKSLSLLETGDTVKLVCSHKLEVTNERGTSSELCQEGCSISSPAVENVAIGELRKSRKKKTKNTIHERKSSDDTSACDLSPKQPEHPPVHYDLGEENPKVEISHVSGEKNQEVSLAESNKEEIALPSTEDTVKDGVIKKDDSLEVFSKEGCSSLLPTVENTSSCTYSANCSDRRPASGRSKFREKKVEYSVDEGKASDKAFVCDSSTKQLEDPQECCDLGENKCRAEVSCAFGSNECHIEEKTLLSKGNVIKDAATIGFVNREDSLLEISPASLEREPNEFSKRKLLILDINGLLADIVPYVPDGYKADRIIGQKALFKRPFCDDFLKFCFERFNVGVWSSRTRRNVDTVVHFLMGDMKRKLLFCWDQSHCTETGFSTVDNKNKPLVLKELKKLWDKHEPNLPWEKGEYNESNTLLLDDSPYKALRNPLHTGVFPSAYRFRDKDDNSLGPGGDIRVYLEGLAVAEDVRKYVEQHRFGQRAITDKNPSWGYYRKVLGIDNPCLLT